MPKLLNHPTPVMRAVAVRLHANHHTGRQRGQKLFHLRAPQLTPHNNLPGSINAVSLEHVLSP